MTNSSSALENMSTRWRKMARQSRQATIGLREFTCHRNTPAGMEEPVCPSVSPERSKYWKINRLLQTGIFQSTSPSLTGTLHRTARCRSRSILTTPVMTPPRRILQKLLSSRRPSRRLRSYLPFLSLLASSSIWAKIQSSCSRPYPKEMVASLSCLELTSGPLLTQVSPLRKQVWVGLISSNLKRAAMRTFGRDLVGGNSDL